MIQYGKTSFAHTYLIYIIKSIDMTPEKGTMKNALGRFGCIALKINVGLGAQAKVQSLLEIVEYTYLDAYRRRRRRVAGKGVREVWTAAHSYSDRGRVLYRIARDLPYLRSTTENQCPRLLPNEA